MRALAEFIMRGRTQAAVVAIIGSWLPLVSAATVALVSFRRGAQDGVLILLWACLPAMLGLFDADIGPLMAMISLAGLAIVMVVALLQRSYQSWPVSLMVAVALGCLAALLVAQFTNPAEDLARALNTVFQPPDQTADLSINPLMALGFIAFGLAANSIASLFVARWWQAILYNPGGFQAEFHGLKLPLVPALVCFAASMYCWLQDGSYVFWALVFALPLLMVGLAIAHSLVKQKQAGKFWLVLAYIALVLFTGPVTLFLSGIALLDTWMNFRSRFTNSPPGA